MRDIDVQDVTRVVRELFVGANRELPPELRARIELAHKTERDPLAVEILGDLLENLEAARELEVPICQDTGMAVLFVELGQEVHFVGGSFGEAVNEGVRQAYLQGNLRCSVVRDPLRRDNTNDNTPAIVHLSLTAGDRVRFLAAPKGFGSENKSAIRLFNPSAAADDIVAFVVDTVRRAGSNPCPPVVVGVGIGGDFELAAFLAKRALCRTEGKPNADPFYAGLEAQMLEAVNALGVGPQGFGGDTTALAVYIETFPTHIAGLPVAVNLGCHVTRHREALL